MTSVTARLKNLRIGPRKVRLVANLLTGRKLAEALNELQFVATHSAAPLLKLLRAAAADAEHNFKLKKDDLFVKQIIVDSAQTYKRFTPRAFGRAAPIRKRGSHVTVTLESKTGAKVESRSADLPAAMTTEVESSDESVRAGAKAAQRERTTSGTRLRTGRGRGFAARLFNRKTG